MDQNSYAAMQQTYYEKAASQWSINDIDHVVGSFHAHNNHADYQEFLVGGFPNPKEMTVLDFGCGPGRNLVRFGPQFKRMDGVDISANNLTNAKLWLEHNKLWQDDIQLIQCNGLTLGAIKDNSYDLVISSITMQHICSHTIRFNYLKEFFRVLKPDGWISIQMGFGPKVDERQKAQYYDDLYNAEGTNGWSDTMVTDVNQVASDLDKIGFRNFVANIRPVGPGDKHPNWIFFRGQK